MQYFEDNSCGIEKIATDYNWNIVYIFYKNDDVYKVVEVPEECD